MSKLTFTVPLGKVTVSKSELDTRMSDIGTLINTTKLEPGDYKEGAIVHRHLKMPPRYTLFREFGWASLADIPNAPYGAPARYKVSGTECFIDVPHNALGNLRNANAPVFNVVARIYQVDSRQTSSILKFGLSYSIDGGVTYVPMYDTERSVGTDASTPTDDAAYFLHNVNQKDPYHGTDGYYVENEPMDRPVFLISSHGGSVESGPSNNPNGVWIAVHADHWDIAAGRVVGDIKVNVRSRED